VSCCVVVTGPPCTGKSTLARAYAARRGWPLLAKDDYKELVFERLGWSDAEWSRRVSPLAWDLAFAAAGALAAVRAPFVVEGNLRAEHAERLLALAPRPAFVVVRCRAPGDVLLARFRARATSANRHPGHADLESLPRIEAELAAGEGPQLALGATMLEYDSGDGFPLDATLARIDASVAVHLDCE
jgi:predicted kinase